eukprot:1144935-Pelagomonas_calceolata.AAC.5
MSCSWLPPPTPPLMPALMPLIAGIAPMPLPMRSKLLPPMRGLMPGLPFMPLPMRSKLLPPMRGLMPRLPLMPLPMRSKLLPPMSGPTVLVAGFSGLRPLARGLIKPTCGGPACFKLAAPPADPMLVCLLNSLPSPRPPIMPPPRPICALGLGLGLSRWWCPPPSPMRALGLSCWWCPMPWGIRVEPGDEDGGCCWR